ncbi:MAG: DUF2069 domain-containing protein [Gammaproteobacteria bacterium]|nr:DUF2069 domain-containing protein [Gammaproteobacteria bacterium]
MNKSKITGAYVLGTQISYFALITLLIAWATLLYPPKTVSIEVILVSWLLPLLFALPGIIQKKRYTFAWLQFVNVIYFCHSAWYLTSKTNEFWLAVLEMVIVLINFTFAVLAIRKSGK